jgi:hypothetical protein
LAAATIAFRGPRAPRSPAAASRLRRWFRRIGSGPVFWPDHPDDSGFCPSGPTSRNWTRIGKTWNKF